MHHLGTRCCQRQRCGTGMGKQRQHSRSRRRDASEPLPLAELFQKQPRLAGGGGPHLQQEPVGVKRQFDLPGIGQGTRKFPLPPFLPRSMCPGDATPFPVGPARFPAGQDRVANAGRPPERRELFRQAGLGQGAIDQNPAQFLQPAAGPEIDEESVVCGRIGRLVHGGREYAPAECNPNETLSPLNR